MWIARDENGKLYIYECEPIKSEHCFYDTAGFVFGLRNKELFPDLTWEDDAVELLIKKGDIYVDCTGQQR